MRIGIIGVGNIGRSLVLHLSRAGHDIKVVNSRGPETIPEEILVNGARPVQLDEAIQDVEVIILSVPLSAIPGLAPRIAAVDESVTIIDTSNYYPQRDGEGFLPEGAVESRWVSEQLGRPIVKAWNSIGSASLATKGVPAGTAGRVALPVAADREQDLTRALRLVEDTGFDAHPAGSIDESWRQQPGNPCYGTDLSLAELPGALEDADAERAPGRRDLIVAVFADRLGAGTNPPVEWGVAVARLICQGF